MITLHPLFGEDSTLKRPEKRLARLLIFANPIPLQTLYSSNPTPLSDISNLKSPKTIERDTCIILALAYLRILINCSCVIL